MSNRTCALLAVCALSISVSGEESGLVNLEAGGRLVARYQPAASPKKPYIKELFTPSGVQLLLDSPGDHVHHHALMFALGAGGTDFWSEKPAEKFGSQAPRAESLKVGPATVAQLLDWKSPQGGVVLAEARNIRAAEPKADGPNVLTWTSELSAPAGGQPVALTGSHYFGLGLRFLPEMNGKAVFLHADGATGTVYRGDERLTPGRWCAIQGEVQGKPVTVAVFDDPRSARPAVWFTMGVPFAYLSATLDLEKHPWPLAAGAPLRCRYGVAMWDGKVPASAIDSACAQWGAAGKD